MKLWIYPPSQFCCLLLFFILPSKKKKMFYIWAWHGISHISRIENVIYSWAKLSNTVLPPSWSFSRQLCLACCSQLGLGGRGKEQNCRFNVYTSRMIKPASFLWVKCLTPVSSLCKAKLLLGCGGKNKSSNDFSGMEIFSHSSSTSPREPSSHS